VIWNGIQMSKTVILFFTLNNYTECVGHFSMLYWQKYKFYIKVCRLEWDTADTLIKIKPGKLAYQ